MPPKVALILCALLVTVLLRIERRRNPDVSRALWIPTIWVLISGSRPVGRWFEVSTTLESSGITQTGSPIDRFVLSGLILLALIVIAGRKLDWSPVLKNNACVIIVYLLIAFSILWTAFPNVALKRWVRVSGAIVMAILVLSERKPLQAMESVLMRSAYILVPFSLLLIKYFPHLGVEYGRWSGGQSWVGVSTQKNGLGQICALSAFILIWEVFRKRRTGELFNNRSETYADLFIIGLAIYLLVGSHSATSMAVLVVALTFALVLYQKENLTRWVADHLKLLMVFLVMLCFLVMGEVMPTVTSLFGRDETLTGRREIWDAVLDIAKHHPLLGVGFGSFWELTAEDMFGVNQAHNGYIGVYLELGIFGLALLFAFMLSFCGKVQRTIKHAFDGGVLGICFLTIVLLYNITESTFFQTSYLWTIFVVMMVVCSEPQGHTKEV